MIDAWQASQSAQGQLAMGRRQLQLSIFLPSLAGGGAEKSMLTLARGFSERGCVVDLVLVRAEGPYKTAVDPRVRVVNLRAPRVLLSLPGLVRYLQHARPPVLISTLDYANVVALWARRLAAVPTSIVVVEQNTISNTARHSKHWRQKIMPRLLKRFYPWADHVVGNSQGVADDLVQITGLPRDRIHVIYNPVVTPEVWTEAALRPQHPWFAPGEPPVVLGVGRLTGQKDFVTLVRAFAAVRRNRTVRLMILGEGPDRDQIVRVAAQLKVDSDVSLPGFVQNPYAYMAHSAVFVLSSRWEGLPTVLIEALACGTRVVATDCPSGPREILVAGQYGPLVPLQEAAELARAITAALDGHTAKPPKDSWRPYELSTVVERYAAICFKHDEITTELAITE